MNEGKIDADQLEGFNRMLVSDSTAKYSLAQKQKKWNEPEMIYYLSNTFFS